MFPGLSPIFWGLGRGRREAGELELGIKTSCRWRSENWIWGQVTLAVCMRPGLIYSFSALIFSCPIPVLFCFFVSPFIFLYFIFVSLLLSLFSFFCFQLSVSTLRSCSDRPQKHLDHGHLLLSLNQMSLLPKCSKVHFKTWRKSFF